MNLSGKRVWGLVALVLVMGACEPGQSRDESGAAGLAIAEDSMTHLFPGVGYEVDVGVGGCEPFSGYSYIATVRVLMEVDDPDALIAQVEEYWQGRPELSRIERQERPTGVGASTGHADLSFRISELLGGAVDFRVSAGGCESEPVPATQFTVPGATG